MFHEGDRAQRVFHDADVTARKLRSQGITRHICERYPLSGHANAVLFFTRAWEIGRMTGYVKNYSSTGDKIAYEHQLENFENIGWMRENPRAIQGA